MLNTKGAMFGLDARIALAIFGALSVISGAALYSAIQSAKLEKDNQMFLETAKAVEAFYLDTGQMPELLTTTTTKISHIIKDTSISNWQGPYINYTEVSEGLIDKQGNPRYQFFLLKQKNDNLGAVTGSPASNSGACTVVTDCGYWLKSHIRTSDMQIYPNAESYALSLDELIDGGDGDSKGKLRINWYGSDRTDPILFYYVMPAYSI